MALPGEVLGQGDSTRLGFCTGEDVSERNEELGKLPDTQELASGLDGVGSLGSHKQDGLVRAHPARENQVTSQQHTYTVKTKIQICYVTSISEDLSHSNLLVSKPVLPRPAWQWTASFPSWTAKDMTFTMSRIVVRDATP